jgi:hypothetical protein
MSDLTPMLQEMAERADATEMLMPHEIRRAGERRRRRFVVATATCAVLGTVAAGLLIRGVARDTASVDPAGQPTPTTSTDSDDRVGIVGPPPPGTPPTGPATGELVAAADLYYSGTWVYGDGRIISAVRNTGSPGFQGYRDEIRGFVVRQLTPSGVEAMRSFLLDGTSGLDPVDKTEGLLIVRDAGRLMGARQFNGCMAWADSSCPGFSEPEQWLPASAWENPTFQPFVPHAYQVCLSHEEFAVLPAEAADVFLASPVRDGLDGGDCRAVATSDARALVDTLEEAGAVRDDSGNNLVLELQGLGNDGYLHVELILPHGSTHCNCG